MGEEEEKEEEKGESRSRFSYYLFLESRGQDLDDSSKKRFSNSKKKLLTHLRVCVFTRGVLI